MELAEAKIKEKVEKRLRRDDRIRESQIHVEVEGNSVRLEGTVNSKNALQAAMNDTYRIKEVKNVNNFLTVTPPRREEGYSDIEIEANIRNALLWDSRIDSTDIDIVVFKQHVELNGTTYSFWEKQLAEEIAFSSTDVKEVTNNLVVNTRDDLNDELIADSVFEALDENPFVNAGDVSIAVNNGMITLSGAVQDYIALSEMHDSLLYIPGVKGIVNNVNVG